MTVTNRSRRANGAGSVYWVEARQRWAVTLTLPDGKRQTRYFTTEQEAQRYLLNPSGPVRRANGAGSVFWVAKLQRWKRAVTLPNGKREIRSFLTEAEAKADLKKTLKDIDDGQVAIASARLSTATYLLGWLENEVKVTQKPLTHESYGYIVTGRLIPAFGKVPLVKLGPQHLQHLQNDMVAAGLSINTIKSTRTCLGAALSYAADNDLIKPATLLAFRKVKVPRPTNVEDEDDEARVFTRDECERFLVAASGDDFEPMFRFMLCTGLRPGEARGVRWRDVDLVGCRLWVRRQSVELKGGRREEGSPKTKKGRRQVPLLAPALAVLTAQQERVKFLKLNPDFNDHDLIFPADDGRPVVSRTVRDHMKNIVEQAGLEHATPHALRHSAATFLLGLGIHERVVMNILGHSSTSTTRGYQHVLDEMVQQAGQAYERLLTEMMS